MTIKDLDNYRPDWARRAEYQDSRPKWQDKIPHGLWELGEVFFPIPPGRKGWNYPHHMQSKRFSADSEVLNGYFEPGWGYGIACANSLAVVDIDEKEYSEYITSELPRTAYQVTGSREGLHLFYKVPGLDQRQNLVLQASTRTPVIAEGYGIESDESKHIGEVKCDPHGYVVGPGSLHPSGNRYGPLNGGSITEINKQDFLRALRPLIYDSGDSSWHSESSNWSEEHSGEGGEITSDYDFYELGGDDVLPWLEPQKRVSHPVHGSETGTNFMKNKDGETFTCWRCTYGLGSGCGINAQQLLALLRIGDDMGDFACEDIRRYWKSDSRLHYHSWRQALDQGLIGSFDIPYRVMKGYAVEKGIIEESEKLSGELYHDIKNSLEYTVMAEKRSDVNQ